MQSHLSRRRILTAALAASAWFALAAHSPYRQWELYRKTRLIILGSASEEASTKAAEATAQLLAAHLPTSKATYARAREFTDIVRLLNSRQHDVALVRDVDAKEALEGSGRFVDDGPTPLRVLARVGAYLLVCRDDFQPAHAYLVVETLKQKWHTFPPGIIDIHSGPRPREPLPIPVHPGALEFYEDRAAPDASDS